jgi:anti-sigma regulatory factor (Ser/Thr protein kinase)
MARNRPRLDARYEAKPESVAQARAAVSSFAARHGATREDLEGVRLAVSEAVTNAVVHAYPSCASGVIHVTATLASGELSVIVADQGCGIGGAGDTPGLGLGLNLIEHTCDSLTVAASPSGGTQLEMRFLLSTGTAEAQPREARGRHRFSLLHPLRLPAFFHDRAPEGGT